MIRRQTATIVKLSSYVTILVVLVQGIESASAGLPMWKLARSGRRQPARTARHATRPYRPWVPYRVRLKSTGYLAKLYARQGDKEHALRQFHNMLNMDDPLWPDTAAGDSLRIRRDREVAAMMADVGYYDHAFRVLQTALILAQVNGDAQVPELRRQAQKLTAIARDHGVILPPLEPVQSSVAAETHTDMPTTAPKPPTEATSEDEGSESGPADEAVVQAAAAEPANTEAKQDEQDQEQPPAGPAHAQSASEPPVSEVQPHTPDAAVQEEANATAPAKNPAEMKTPGRDITVARNLSPAYCPVCKSIPVEHPHKPRGHLMAKAPRSSKPSRHLIGSTVQRLRKRLQSLAAARARTRHARRAGLKLAAKQDSQQEQARSGSESPSRTSNVTSTDTDRGDADESQLLPVASQDNESRIEVAEETRRISHADKPAKASSGRPSLPSRMLNRLWPASWQRRDRRSPAPDRPASTTGSKTGSAGSPPAPSGNSLQRTSSVAPVVKQQRPRRSLSLPRWTALKSKWWPSHRAAGSGSGRPTPGSLLARLWSRSGRSSNPSPAKQSGARGRTPQKDNTPAVVEPDDNHAVVETGPSAVSGRQDRYASSLPPKVGIAGDVPFPGIYPLNGVTGTLQEVLAWAGAAGDTPGRRAIVIRVLPADSGTDRKTFFFERLDTALARQDRVPIPVHGQEIVIVGQQQSQAIYVAVMPHFILQLPQQSAKPLTAAQIVRILRQLWPGLGSKQVGLLSPERDVSIAQASASSAQLAPADIPLQPGDVLYVDGADLDASVAIEAAQAIAQSAGLNVKTPSAK